MINSFSLQDKESVRSFLPQKQKISHSQIQNVPNKVTLNYRISPCKITSEIPSAKGLRSQYTKQPSDNKGPRKIIVLHRNKKNKAGNVSSQTKKGKLNLLSSRLNHHNYSAPLKHQQISLSMESEPFSSMKQNHILVVDSFACDIFNCNGEQAVDQWERKPQDIYQSEPEDSVNPPQIATFQKHHQLILEDSRQKCSSFNESFRMFSKRKNLFDTSTLNNTTIQFGSFQRSQRSIFRKGIFTKREKNQDRSMTFELSYLKQQLKDSPRQKSSPKFGVQKHEELLEISDIPKCILDSWQQFTESSAAGNQSRKLEIANEANLSELQVS